MASKAEIVIFHPNSRKAHLTISSLIPAQVFSAVENKLGAKEARNIEKCYNALHDAGMDSGQMKLGDRRVRIKVPTVH